MSMNFKQLCQITIRSISLSSYKSLASSLPSSSHQGGDRYIVSLLPPQSSLLNELVNRPPVHVKPGLVLDRLHRSNTQRSYPKAMVCLFSHDMGTGLWVPDVSSAGQSGVYVECTRGNSHQTWCIWLLLKIMTIIDRWEEIIQATHLILSRMIFLCVLLLSDLVVHCAVIIPLYLKWEKLHKLLQPL